MTFVIHPDQGERQPFDEYRYVILRDGQLVARYRHDYRGDDHAIEFLDGRREYWPVGHMTEFMVGGGPQPLGLSDAAVTYLKLKLDVETR